MNNLFLLTLSGQHPRYLADDGELGEKLEIANGSRFQFEAWDASLESQASPSEIQLRIAWENGQVDSYAIPPPFEWQPIIPAGARVGRAQGEIIIAGIALPFYPFLVVVAE